VEMPENGVPGWAVICSLVKEEDMEILD
jgi:hypothetical protein